MSHGRLGNPQQTARRTAVVFLDMRADNPERGGQHRSVIGKPKRGDHIRHGISRHHEIGQRAQEDGLGLARGFRVDGGVIGGGQIVGEGDAPGHFQELREKASTGRSRAAIDGKRGLRPVGINRLRLHFPYVRHWPLRL